MAEAKRIVGISMIRNDADIVEPFVRHALRVLDHLFVIVHCPQDGTDEILSALHAEGLPMTLVFDGEPAFLEGERFTWLAREAFAAFRPDCVFPLDADEFIVPPARAAIEEALAPLPPDAVAGRVRLRTFVTTSEDQPTNLIRCAGSATGHGMSPKRIRSCSLAPSPPIRCW